MSAHYDRQTGEMWDDEDGPPPEPIDPRRRAVAFLGSRELALLLQLPEGQQVIGMQPDFLRDGMLLMVRGADLDVVPEGHHAPNLSGSWVWEDAAQRLVFHPER